MTRFNNKGFTLVELLIVIAILGTLAVVVLLALNPVQQLARTRDSGRASTVTQLGHAMEAFATTRGGVYPTDSAVNACLTGTTTGTDWITNCLGPAPSGSGEIQSIPGPVLLSSTTGGAYACPASAVGQNGWCYDGTSTQAVIYTLAEAQANTSRCGTLTAYFVFSTTAGRGGLWCGGAAPAPGITGTDGGWRN